MADSVHIRKRDLLAGELAGRSTDPRLMFALDFLPNPDPVLRRLGLAGDAYRAIGYDAHVLGELRSVRAGLLGHEWRVVPGADDPASMRAYELVQQYMAGPPAPGMRWPDVIWNIALAVFQGLAATEVIWERQGGAVMPAALKVRSWDRWRFGGTVDELRVVTRNSQVRGEPVPAMRILLTRHMPSYEQPYGVAVFSSCFWPFHFKRHGFRFLAKLSERFGSPWPVGKYPEGATQEQQDALLEALTSITEGGAAVVPQDADVALLQSSQSGRAPQERLIDMCNREMSKALTSQTLATEIQGEASHAASETHRGREQAVNQSDRQMVADTISELFEWISVVNVSGATPPRFEFYREQAERDWLETLDKARHFLPIGRAVAYHRLGIKAPEANEDTLPAGSMARPGPAEFGAGGVPRNEPLTPEQKALEDALASIGDDALGEQAQALLGPIVQRAKKDPDAVLGELADIYPAMAYEALQQKLGRLLFVADTWGRLNATGDRDA